MDIVRPSRLSHSVSLSGSESCCSVVLLNPEAMRREEVEEERDGDGAGHHPVTHGNAISCSGRSCVSHCVWIGREQVF